jgi:GTPase involved in cell partitioning and DNA repair
MEVKIYCIEDINDLKYIGSTKSKLNVRLNNHKCKKDCSSSKLNLYNCIITELECCNEENRKEREKYWINKIDCVNERRLNYDHKQYNKVYNKQYYQNNKIKESHKEYCKEYNKQYNKLHWYCSDCKCNVKLNYKSRHLKTQKHQLNTNNYLI